MRDPALLAPPVRELYFRHLELCAQAKIIVFPTCTLRLQVEHDAIYAQGRQPLLIVNSLRLKAGMPPITERQNVEVSWAPKSPHLAGPGGLSRAYDLAIRGPLGALWDIHADPNCNGKPEWKEVADLGVSLGLTAGYYFRGHMDAPHFELPASIAFAGVNP